MSFACDGILIGIILFTVLCGCSKGFIKSFMGLIKGVASAFAAYSYTPLLAAYLNDNYIMQHITEGIDETLRSLSLDTATDLYNLDRLAADLPEPLISILERYNINVSDFVNHATGMTGVEEEVVRDYSASIASPTASLLSSAISFTVIFVGVFLALSLITGLLDIIFHMPVLNAANKLFGFLFGVAEAYVIVTIMSILLSAIITSLGSIEPNLFGADVIEHTVLCKFFVEHNPIDKIYNVIR